jgi:hypothetical protein
MKEAFSQQHILEDKIEDNKCDIQARLEVVEAKTGGEVSQPSV